MPKAFVLMKAMPPTTGHLQLIRFAEVLVGDYGVTVLMDTTADEPMVVERLNALRRSVRGRGSCTEVRHIENEMEDPAAEGFWQYWHGVLTGLGLKPGDYIVGSEPYCKTLAEKTGAIYMPYDPVRYINSVRATGVRKHPAIYWEYILPEFRKHLQLRVTIFGAESTGKTRLTNALRFRNLDERNEDPMGDNELDYFPEVTTLPEYARPYLENTVNEITEASMTAIWKGQAALQRQQFLDHPIIVQDTDLFSTVGYWDQFRYNPWPWNLGQPEGAPYRGKIGSPPDALLEEARELRSDLYIVTPSNIPFTADPLRYGGDHREIEDRVWNNLCARERLNFHILTCDPKDRTAVAADLIKKAFAEKAKKIAYDRPAQ